MQKTRFRALAGLFRGAVYHKLIKPILAYAGNEFTPVSYYKDYKIIVKPDTKLLRNRYLNVWKQKEIPRKQWQITSLQMDDPNKIVHFRTTVDLIRKTGMNNPKILEIGCSSGYHSEVFKKAGLKCFYEGCDYSPYFISMAKKLYPGVPFKVSDATKLDYHNREFNIAISGSCILHIIDYKKAISEASRVAKDYVIFSRTPILSSESTKFVTKHAYGEEMLEILFSEQELLDLFYQAKMAVISVRVLSQFWVQGINEPVFIKSYLCRKS